MNHTLRFDGIYRFHYKTVYRTARWWGVPERDAEDVTQVVFLKLHGLLRHVDPSRNLRPYLVALTISTARNYHTVRNRQERLLLSVELPEPATPEEEASHHERVEVAMRLVEQLDPDLRAVYIMAVVHEIPHAEIAELLGIPLSTVTARLRAAREQIEMAVQRLCARKKIPAVWIGPEAFDRVIVPADAEARVRRRISSPRRWTHAFASAAAGAAILCGSAVPAAFSHNRTDRAQTSVSPSVAAVAGFKRTESVPRSFGTALTAKAGGESASLDSGSIKPTDRTRASACPSSPRARRADNAILAPQPSIAPTEVPADLKANRDGTTVAQGHDGPSPEVVIIQQARQAMIAGNLALARRELERHRRLYPNGLMRRIRDQLLAEIEQIR